MKKTLIAMAAVAVAGVSSAQVTITGSLGFGLRDSSTQATEWDWTDGGVKFSATEDLGGGMSVSVSNALSFKGQSGNPTQDGSSITVNTGATGTVTYASGAADADSLGVGSMLTDAGATISADTDNYTTLDYTLPTIIDGLGVTVRWNKDNAGSVAVTDVVEQYRLSYTMGPASVYFNTKGGASPASDLKVVFDAGVAKITGFTQTKVAAGTLKRSEYSISAPVGPVTIAMSSMSYSGGSTLAGKEFDIQYPLSKRTTLRASYGSFTTGNTTTTGSTAAADSSARAIKLVHTF
jgi:hypothetical protein